MTRSGSTPSLSSSSPISPTSTATSPSTPTSSASSSLSKGSTAKRSRKSSFPLLFGRKSLDSSRSQVVVDQAYVEEPLPFSPTTPGSAPPLGADGQPQGLLFSSHNSGPNSAPPTRGTFTRTVSGLPSPPITPTSPSRPLSKKEVKQKAKEELALVKELERVDKLVKQHDVKARKAQEKAQAKERKRAAKLAQINEPYQQAERVETRPSVDTYSSTQSATRSQRKTVFQAATKGGHARRTSVRSAAEVRTFTGERRGSEPVLSNSAAAVVSTPFSMDLPDSERLPFSQPRAAPQPNIPTYPTQQSSQIPYQKTLSDSPIEEASKLSQDTSPPRPMRPAPPAPAQDISPLAFSRDVQPTRGWSDIPDPETSMSEDPDESQGWNRSQRSWSELNSEFAGPLPSLIHPSTSSNSVSTTEEVEFDERKARRASVQRVLALSDAKRGSRQYLTRQASNGAESKRSSTASNGRRRSFIRQIGQEEGWSVVNNDTPSHPDDSTIAQPDLSGAIWSDWVEDRLPSEERVDLVLADLFAAQRGHTSDENGERTPTQETPKDPFTNTKVRERKASPTRPDRSARRNDPPISPTNESSTHSSSLSSTDSLVSQSSGTGTVTTVADVGEASDDKVCFSRGFAVKDKENAVLGTKSGEMGKKDSSKSDFRLSLALAPLQLQPLELFTGVGGKF